MEIPLRYRFVAGLDPALPLFMTGDSNTHLSAGDAKFVGMTFLSLRAASNRYDHVFLRVVDVIHTDGGFFGIPWALGHVDFYPNNGVALQPGCVQEELSKNNFLGIVGEFRTTPSGLINPQRVFRFSRMQSRTSLAVLRRIDSAARSLPQRAMREHQQRV